MFTDTAPADLLAEICGHDFGDDPFLELDANRVDAISSLDRTIRVAQAQQVTQIIALHTERIRAMGLGTGDASLSVIGEVSMARTISLSAAATQFTLAIGLSRLPKVMALFTAGLISEQAARAVVNETISLGVDDFCLLDAEIAPLLVRMTARQARDATARAVIRIDAEAARVRAVRNRADQRVSIFPDSDGVAVLQVRGPAEQIVATYNTLDSYARGLRACGDERTTGQIMVHTLVERVTGTTHADDVGVEIGLVMHAATLLAGSAYTDSDDPNKDAPVDLIGYGPISPDIADDIIANAPTRSVRRLLVDPIDGTLIARDTTRRFYDGPLRGFIRRRDKRCRQPACDRTIRELDHLTPHTIGGPTTLTNGQGLCGRSHKIKELPGWHIRGNAHHTITWTTPTGHTYESAPPAVLPTDQPPQK